MNMPRPLKWIAALVLAPIVLAVLFILIFGWNWLRAPIERMALDKTGRELSIVGDLNVTLAWPLPRIHAAGVTFANPDWATERQLLAADAVEISIDLPQLLRRNIVIPEMRLTRPVVYLEQASGGRKNWLLDLNQQDEQARIRIEHLWLDQGRLGYDDATQKTHIRAELSTEHLRPPASTDASTVASAAASTSTLAVASVTSPAAARFGIDAIRFTARGLYEGLALNAHGDGGPLLALRDETTPYPLRLVASVGPTHLQADGTITSLLKLVAMDIRLTLRGNSLNELYPLLGIAFPATHAYTTSGHLLHHGKNWRYAPFTGRIGNSDVVGSLQVDTGGKRPALKAEAVSKLLDLADLGPVIGARANVTRATAAQARVLPDLPFNTDRWSSVDAEVSLTAKNIRRAAALPLENLTAHLSLRDSVLTLDPLTLGVAGGQLQAKISLDGRRHPIQARAQVRAKKMHIVKLLPTLDLSKSSVGQINGEFNLNGQGDSVGRMLATANGKLGLSVAGGEISKLLMEKISLHLWEILVLKLTGDKRIKLHCGVADFSVRKGVMRADTLLLDTEVTTLVGSGSIDLAQEKLDLTLDQKTKETSPVALTSPIYLRGSFAHPVASIDMGRVAARGLGAVALGIVAPLLALVPLVDPDRGEDRDCARLIRAVK